MSFPPESVERLVVAFERIATALEGVSAALANRQVKVRHPVFTEIAPSGEDNDEDILAAFHTGGPRPEGEAPRPTAPKAPRVDVTVREMDIYAGTYTVETCPPTVVTVATGAGGPISAAELIRRRAEERRRALLSGEVAVLST